MNKARDKFINTLIQRIYDKSSFCRWHVLGILNQLTIERAVPKKYTIMFLKAGVDRIKDHSVNTRKKALQLINTIIEDVWPEDRTLRSLASLKE
jgi:condensin complex subunit 1